MNHTIIAVILAAGKGTRMKSARAKVLHEVFFRPMLHHVLNAVTTASVNECAVIIGHQRDEVSSAMHGFPVITVVQEQQLGTGHAVLCAEPACTQSDTVMILCGDTPLIQPATLQAMIAAHQQGNSSLTLMTTLLDNPFGYGRILCAGQDSVAAIVEEKDATVEQRAIREVNAGIYLVDRQFLFTALRQVGTDNSQGEIYLTDIVAIANQKGLQVKKFVHPHALDVLGVNSRVELAQAHAILQYRRNHELMLSGVTLYDPSTTVIDMNCFIGQDTTIQGPARISGSSSIGKGCLLGTGCVLHDCTLGDGVIVGAHAVLHHCTVPAGSVIAPLTLQDAG